MYRKTLLLTATCFIFVSMPFIKSMAQQNNKSVKGNMFLHELHPAAPATDVTGARVLSGRVHLPYRSFDGTNNNISSNQRRAWGSADILLYRELPPAYGPSDPNNAMGGVNRPSARQISNVLIDEPVTQFNTRGLSTLVYQWGQFLDHEMDLTPTDTTEYVPISLPPDEVIFTEEIPFFRSEFRSTAGNRSSVRQQINLNTAWIDGSVVYGSDPIRARWLRTLSHGKMKTSAGNLLPFNTVNGESTGAIDPHAPAMANDVGGTLKTFVAGDVRASENPVLISIHTLFVREHNRICDRLISEGLTNDEQIYQMARKEVGALIQAITYQEFLPSLGITLRQYPGYKDDARPDIANTFATAAYRLGHTMVSDDVLLVDNDCEEVGPGEMDLVEVFWNPQLVSDNNIEIFLKGATTHDQYETDTKINDVLRNFLFVSPNDPVRFGIDLGSLNIQRGRDHGLPDYNTARRFYTGKAARKFSDITSNDTIATSLKNLYGNVNNIDLWIGILSEDHLPGSSVGKTLHEMLRAQFEKLRDGDFYFYRNDPYLPANIRNQIRNTRFSDVIKRNTALTNIAGNVFHTEACPEDSVADFASRMKTVDISRNAEYKIYPNPVHDILNVDLVSSGQSGTIQLFSANGILVKTISTAAHEQNIQINISGLVNGMYVMNIISGKETRSFKFVKL